MDSKSPTKTGCFNRRIAIYLVTLGNSGDAAPLHVEWNKSGSIALILRFLRNSPRGTREGYKSQIIIYRYQTKILFGKSKIGICTEKTKPPLIGLSAHSSSIAQASRRIVGKLSSTRAAATSVAFSSRGFRRRIHTESIAEGCFRWTGSGARFPPWPEVRCVPLRRSVLGIGVFLA